MLTQTERDQLTRLANSHDSLPAEPGNLRVWWIPQIPGKPFHYRVADLDQALLLLSALAAYDAFQLVHNIKGDYANTGGLEIFDTTELKDGEWVEWCDPETGNDIHEYRDGL